MDGVKKWCLLWQGKGRGLQERESSSDGHVSGRAETRGRFGETLRFESRGSWLRGGKHLGLMKGGFIACFTSC
jgi:hypothetical protein